MNLVTIIMESFKKKFIVPESRKIMFDLPSNIPTDSEIEVVILYKNKNLKNKKINELRESINDSVFQADIKNISEDFSIVDNENI